jgi:hypothetical protein
MPEDENGFCKKNKGFSGDWANERRDQHRSKRKIAGEFKST